jgi:ribonucleoside-diphosphate reductase subunit M1
MASPQRSYNRNVRKRNGSLQPIDYSRISERIGTLAEGLNVDTHEIVKKTIDGVVDGIPTTKLDDLAAEMAAYMVTIHPDHDILAGRIAISNLQKNTHPLFSECVYHMYHYVNPETHKPASLVSKEVYEITRQFKDKLDSAIDNDRDYSVSYFGLATLKRSYLKWIKDASQSGIEGLEKVFEPGESIIMERPQYLYMRVALGIHMGWGSQPFDLGAAIETYDALSLKLFSHASPTLFNSGTPVPQMSSCFLVAMKDDSIDGIYDTLKECAKISKTAGGIGMHMSNIRAQGAYIVGTNGTSNGLVPMLQVYNATARYVDQGGGKRPGAFSIYLEPWHADIFSFLDIRRDEMPEENRSKDLFTAMWTCDLFMERVENDAHWTLFSPDQAPDLCELWGDAFRKRYEELEESGIGETVKAMKVWSAMLVSISETGTPYVLFSDACNRKSNQQNLGKIKSSNLCCEVVQFSSKDETAVCNLASLGLPSYINDQGTTAPKRFDFVKLGKATRVLVRNLDKIIDRNHYPVETAKRSNLRHRPMGIGVAGLANVFQILGHTFGDAKSRELNRDIFETIYYHAVLESVELAKKYGSYETFHGSPASKGLLQPDLWEQEWEQVLQHRTPGMKKPEIYSPRLGYYWETLKVAVQHHGLRNSLMVAPMPTASTAQILGFNECFEPITSNMYRRNVSAGSFTILNRHMVSHLVQLGLWTAAMSDKIKGLNGNIQGMTEVPQHVRSIYKTAWDIPASTIIDMAADRGIFCDQSQSMNIWKRDPEDNFLTKILFRGWKRGLKTGMYYNRTASSSEAVKFTLDPSKLPQPTAAVVGPKQKQYTEEEKLMCSMENKEACMACGT